MVHDKTSLFFSPGYPAYLVSWPGLVHVCRYGAISLNIVRTSQAPTFRAVHAPTSILPVILLLFVAPASNNNCSTPQRRGAAPYEQAPHHPCWKSVVKNISIIMMSDFISPAPRVIFRTYLHNVSPALIRSARASRARSLAAQVSPS